MEVGGRARRGEKEGLIYEGVGFACDLKGTLSPIRVNGTLKIMVQFC